MVLFDLHIFILDLMKSGNSGNENIIQKLNFNKKIINAYIIKNKLVIIFTDGEIITYEINIKEEENKNEDKKEEKEEKLKEDNKEEKIIKINTELKINLEKPDKKNENDVDIRIRFVSISKIDKIKIITISFSNNEIYFYDLNKIIKYEEIEKENTDKKQENQENKINNHFIKKYGKIEYNIPGKVTSLDSELTK